MGGEDTQTARWRLPTEKGVKMRQWGWGYWGTCTKRDPTVHSNFVPLKGVEANMAKCWCLLYVDALTQVCVVDIFLYTFLGTLNFSS